MILTSSHNPRIKQAIKLRDKRMRDHTQTFIIEGYRELSLAVGHYIHLKTLFYSPFHFLGSNERTLIERVSAQHVPIFEVHHALFERLSYRDRPDGLLAIAAQNPLTLSDLKLKQEHPSFFLVAESIEKPGNLGSMLRSADAAGVDALLVCDRCTDIYNPNVVRASVGTLFTIPVLEVTSDEAIEYLRNNGIRIVATSPDAKSIFTQVDFSQSVAIVVGTEQIGLSPQWMECADIAVKIPMRGIADSLNVAAATTLLLYEVLRKRA